MGLPGRVNVAGGIVLRSRMSSLSSKATVRYKAHRPECRYAGSANESLANLVERMGEYRVAIKCAVGIVEPCSYCEPDVLSEEKPSD